MVNTSDDDDGPDACLAPLALHYNKREKLRMEEKNEKEEKGRERRRGDDGQIRNRGLRLSRS